MAGRIAVVDGQDRFLRWEQRAVIHRERLVHRSVHVLVFDSRGRLVIQKRHPEKDNNPNAWDVSCAGHVEESDYTGGPDEGLDAVYRGVAIRELAEELGVETELEELASFTPIAGVHYEQIRLYRGISDGPYVIQEDEVSEIRPATQAELRAMIDGEDLVTTSLTYFAGWLAERDMWPAR
jgi:isopentenyldiphosphate isomerase